MSVDLAHNEMFRAKVGEGGIKMHLLLFVNCCSHLVWGLCADPEGGQGVMTPSENSHSYWVP